MQIPSKLLEKDGTRLKYLDIDSADMEDEEAETFANSLKFNTVLTGLDLGGENNITEKGFTLFFRLLNDVSSIKAGSNAAFFLPESYSLTFSEPAFN